MVALVFLLDIISKHISWSRNNTTSDILVSKHFLSLDMYTQLVEFATPQFAMALKLRDKVLRKPLNMVFKEEDIAKEYDSMHLACFNDYNQLIGIMVLKPISKKVIKMRQVAVDPEIQSRGVGTFMAKSAEMLVKSKGYNKLVLHARASAVAFYEKLNYNIEGEQFEEVGIPHYKMQKKLS